VLNPAYRFDRRRESIGGVPFAVGLHEMPGVHMPGGQLKVARYAPEELEKRRDKRLQLAVDSKLPKLNAWKAMGAATILVLENDDIALTNVGLVSEVLSRAIRDGSAMPDRVYQVDTCIPDWNVWTLHSSGDGGIRTESWDLENVATSLLIDLTRH
jgi:hypothetical protein